MRGLHYSDAIARHLSVKGAAEELGVSQSALIHHMPDLTDTLGEQLFVRSGSGIGLTATGQWLAEKLCLVFSGLQSSLEDVIGGNQAVLRLAVGSSVGPGCLIPLWNQSLGCSVQGQFVETLRKYSKRMCASQPLAN